MKKLIICFIIATFLLSPGFSIPDSLSVETDTIETDTTKVKIGSGNVVQVIDESDGTKVIVGQGGIIVYEKRDTIKIKIGNKGVKIIETDDGTKVDILDFDELEKEFNYKPIRKFRGHWAGFEFAMNNYLTSDFKLPDNFMNLYTGKSWNVNFNIMQFSLNIAKQNIGLVTGLGFQLNDYKFSRNNNIMKDANGNITELPYTQQLNVSKLHVDYLTIPLLLEFHLDPDRWGRKLFISTGVIGAIKLNSYTKVVYYDQGTKIKDKTRDDFSINPLQLNLSLRAGFKFIKVFANYNVIQLFQTGKGTELYQFSVGLMLLSF